ncbi:MAG: hypothetical protein PWP31_1939 [Clostridia bacterium]|nr:hypothetical protein [Clostridia bacterium]
MKKNICVVTATRAEYGLLKPIVRRLKMEPEFNVDVAVTGAHLSPEFGLTYREIENNGIEIDEKVEILLSGDTAVSVTKSMGLALIGFADYFARKKTDLLILLGDRYETLAVAIAAFNQRIPIAHLYGGEATEGALDDAIRHAVTKLSYLHFTSTETYRRRVIQLGEAPERVFCVGAVGVENALNTKLLSREELEKILDFPLDKPYIVVTFHPVTLEEQTAEKQIKALLNVCREYKDLKFIFTKANADEGGRVINHAIEQFVKENSNVKAYDSLGNVCYLSALKYCMAVVGNSSSGLIEAPSIGIPTVNIGDRQKGRIQATSVVNCKPEETDIRKAFALALSREFREKAQKVLNPYGDGRTSDKVVGIVKDFLINKKINLKKKFYDIHMRGF